MQGIFYAFNVFHLVAPRPAGELHDRSCGDRGPGRVGRLRGFSFDFGAWVAKSEKVHNECRGGPRTLSEDPEGLLFWMM